jgi:hypothetical protein
MSSSPSTLSTNNQVPTTSINSEQTRNRKTKLQRTTIINSENSPSEGSEENEEVEEQNVQINLKYGLEQIIKILIPVTICLFFVIITVNMITSYQKNSSQTL